MGYTKYVNAESLLDRKKDESWYKETTAIWQIQSKISDIGWLDVTGRVRIDNSTSDYEEKRYASTNTLFASETGFYRLNKTDDRQVYADIMANINKRIDDFFFSS